jgi:hypothetical protein
MDGLKIFLPAMAILGSAVFADQANASPVTVTFEVSPSTLNVYYADVYASSGQNCGIAPSTGTCVITLPSQGRYRFRFEFKKTRGVSAQSIEFWQDIPNTGTFTVDVPVHDVTFNRTGTNGSCGNPVSKIFALSSASVAYGQDITRPDNYVGGTGGYSSPSVQIVQVPTAGSTTTPMLDGCYTITSGTPGCPGTSSACKTIVGPLLCVGDHVTYDFTAPCP